MKTSALCLAIALLALRAAAVSQTTAIRCGTLIDGLSDTPRKNAVIIVDGKTITAVAREVPRGSRD